MPGWDLPGRVHSKYRGQGNVCVYVRHRGDIKHKIKLENQKKTLRLQLMQLVAFILKCVYL